MFDVSDVHQLLRANPSSNLFKSFQKLQMIENNRLKSLKECITTLTSIQTDIHKKEMEATDKLLATAVCFEPQEDIDLFCSQKGNKAADGMYC